MRDFPVKVKLGKIIALSQINFLKSDMLKKAKFLKLVLEKTKLATKLSFMKIFSYTKFT